jgi:hypothetical protein
MASPTTDPPPGAAEPRDKPGGLGSAILSHSIRSALIPVFLVLGALLIIGATLAVRAALAPPASTITSRPLPTLLTSVRDIARLETTEIHVEKVIDLTDTQSRFFGLVEVTDALLLVAVGRATVGIDLSKLRDGDVYMDPESRAATLTLPQPELLSASLDERATFVYSRSTSLLAKRNEGLEGKARREAVLAIEKAALEGDVLSRAKSQAERQLRALVTQLGASSVTINWR